jgi:hypothetical protein
VLLQVAPAAFFFGEQPRSDDSLVGRQVAWLPLARASSDLPSAQLLELQLTGSRILMSSKGGARPSAASSISEGPGVHHSAMRANRSGQPRS